MTNCRCRHLLFLSLLAITPLLIAQGGWHKTTMFGLNNAPLTKLRGIAIPAEAVYKGQHLKAYVFFSGYDGHAGGPGYPFFGVYVENIEKYIPESEIDKFRGPDLSQYATKNDAIQLNVTQGNSRREITTRLLFTDGMNFDSGFQAEGSFETNPRETKIATDTWMQFLAQMSNGFEDGKAVIGGRGLSGELTVKFSGVGLGTKLKELIAYCKRQ